MAVVSTPPPECLVLLLPRPGAADEKYMCLQIRATVCLSFGTPMGRHASIWCQGACGETPFTTVKSVQDARTCERTRERTQQVEN